MNRYAMPPAVPPLLRGLFEEEMDKLGLCLDDLRFTEPRLMAYIAVSSRLLTGELDRRVKEETQRNKGE